MTRSRTIRATQGAIWDVISDPHHLPRWWPSLERVEEASPAAWTKVLRTEKGKPVRADYTRLSAHEPETLVWRQELAESPFERILSEATTQISLEPQGEGATRVALRQVRKLRGLSRLGGFLVRRATARQLDEALDGLEAVTAGR